ncbi:MAG: Rieske 2Fe-2S domain-containing protein [Actinomycetota bacterium]
MLPSEELPRPHALYEQSPALARREASSSTVVTPTIRRVRVGRSDVLLTRLISGEVVAFGTNCPHQATPLELASVYEGRLRCAKHQYLYDPRTGENIFPSRDSRPENIWKLKPGYLPTYRVEEREGWIWVAEAPNAPPASYDPEREKPPPTRPPFPPPLPAEAAGKPQPKEAPAESMTVALHAEFDLALPTQVVPSHLWRVESTGEAVAVLLQTFEPGPPVVYRVRLAARAPGEATVRCVYSTPWGRVPKEVRTFAVTVGDRSEPG